MPTIFLAYVELQRIGSGIESELVKRENCL